MFGDTHIHGHARIVGHAHSRGHARIGGHARIPVINPVHSQRHDHGGHPVPTQRCP